ncbi:MAG: ATP-binding cassette domain-containing protein [Verrucomicrobiota bacterium]|jgi:phospholipid/cholesterol/gamma-HCH transport system ATP-binding protein
MSLPAAPAPQNVLVEVRDLHKSFHGQEVLKGITFKIAPGGIFVIMGPSGSGKSVLLKHIIGLMKPDSGQILIQGRSIDSPDLRDKFRMAMVFQSGALLTSLTVAENVGLYLSEHQLAPPDQIARVVASKLAAVGLEGVEDRMPNELSGGMQKRVAIARALVGDPQLILFDEPTGELDPLMAVTIGEEILKLKSRTQATSIVVTHDRSLAFGIADGMAMILEGRILFIGAPGELRRNPDPLIQHFLQAELPPLNPNPSKL